MLERGVITKSLGAWDQKKRCTGGEGQRQEIPPVERERLEAVDASFQHGGGGGGGGTADLSLCTLTEEGKKKEKTIERHGRSHVELKGESSALSDSDTGGNNPIPIIIRTRKRETTEDLLTPKVGGKKKEKDYGEPFYKKASKDRKNYFSFGPFGRAGKGWTSRQMGRGGRGKKRGRGGPILLPRRGGKRAVQQKKERREKKVVNEQTSYRILLYGKEFSKHRNHFLEGLKRLCQGKKEKGSACRVLVPSGNTGKKGRGRTEFVLQKTFAQLTYSWEEGDCAERDPGP